PSDSCHEVGTIGEVEVVDSCFDARFHYEVSFRAVLLERPRRIDNEIGPFTSERPRDVRAIELQRANRSLTAPGAAERRRSSEVSPGNQHLQVLNIGEQFGETSAEYAVSAEHQNSQRASFQRASVSLPG